MPNCSSNIVTPTGTTCSSDPCCGTTTTCSSTENQKLTLGEGQTLAELLASLPDGETFRLEIPDIWPDGCVIAAMKDSSVSSDYIPLNVATGSFAETPVVIATSGTAVVATPHEVSGNIDLAALSIEPRCGTRAITVEIDPTSAIGSVSINGAQVWVAAAADSTNVDIEVDIEQNLIPYVIQLTDGKVDLSYKGDVV